MNSKSNFFRCLVLAAGVFLLPHFLSCKAKSTLPAEKPESSLPVSKVDFRKPFEVSNNFEDKKRCNEINNLISESKYRSANWGFAAVSLSTGKLLCAKNENELFVPASIEKLLTSIVSLEKLGEEFRWETRVYSDFAAEAGVVKGNIYLYGGGAPDLTTADIVAFAKAIKNKGIRRIEGDVIGDESFFKGDSLGDGWSWNEIQWYYGAAASALSIDMNRAEVTVKPGAPGSNSKYVSVSGEIQPVDDIEAFGLKRELGTNNVFVWGNSDHSKVQVSIAKPALLAALILKENLEKEGVEISGEARARNWLSADKLNPNRAFLWETKVSKPLGEVVQTMNKDSVNLYAELMLRMLGKNFGSEAPDDDPKIERLRGDDLAGAAVIKKWLLVNGIAGDEIAIHDGSGLSRLDLLTPETFVRALLFVSESKNSHTLYNSLPIAGKDGTLKSRLIGHNIVAKTGSFMYVNSLAGFKVGTETVAFAIIGNNITTGKDSNQLLDRIVVKFGN
ncbi:MAG: D-alanyl-D-alanine carboxypeptidase/D-alanyl-D-alanine-endopeptidase [Pyrinomonadaceae bacterium]